MNLCNLCTAYIIFNPAYCVRPYIDCLFYINKNMFFVISIMQSRHKLHSVTCLFNCLFTTHLFWFLVMIDWNMHGRSNCMQNNDLPVYYIISDFFYLSYRFKMLFQIPNLRSVYRTTGFYWPFVTAYCLNTPWINYYMYTAFQKGGFTLIRHKIKY